MFSAVLIALAAAGAQIDLPTQGVTGLASEQWRAVMDRASCLSQVDNSVIIANTFADIEIRGPCGAYRLMWSMRALMHGRSRWRAAQFDTLRLRLIKLAVSIKVLKTRVQLHLPQATPDQALFALLLMRMPRLSI